MIVTLTLRTQTVTLTVAALNTSNGGGSGVSVHNQLTGRDTADAHPQSAVTGLVAALAAKAASDHTHTAAQVGADAAGTAATAVGALAATLGTAATKDVGTTAGTVAAGDDARLSDARTPTAHNQDASTITSGTLDAARLPAPGTATLGGVKRNTGSAGQYVTGVDTDGSLLRDTPAGASPAGSGTEIQVRNGSSLGAIAGTSWASNQLLIAAQAAAVTPLALRAATSHTANIQEWQNSAGTALAYIDSTGAVRSASFRDSNVGQGRLTFQSGYTSLYGYDGKIALAVDTATGFANFPFGWMFGPNYYTNDIIVSRLAAGVLRLRGTSDSVGAALNIRELSADPADPPEGTFTTWMSDGAGAGDDGDIMVKITAGGVTKTATLIDFSAV